MRRALLALAVFGLVAAAPPHGIVIIGEMHAKPGRGGELHARMLKEVPPPSTKGLRQYEVLRSDGDPDRIVIVEGWDSQADHDAAARAIPPASIKAVMEMLGEPPSGETFRR